MDSSLSLTEMSQSQFGTSMPIGEEESIPLLSSHFSIDFASPSMKSHRPELWIIGAVAQNSRHFAAAGLTRGPLDYLIRASASQAQVAQSVEQRTENPRVGGSIPPLGTIYFFFVPHQPKLGSLSFRLNQAVVLKLKGSVTFSNHSRLPPIP